MLGAVAGDIIGSPYEWNNTQDRYFELCWKSPVRVTPEAQVPLTLESKFRMTPIKS